MTTLVFGASGAIGRATVAKLLQKGRSVIAADVVAVEMSNVRSAQVDLSSFSEVKKFIDEVELSEPIESIIYAAGLNTTGPVDSINWDRYEQVMAVNLKGAFHVGAAIQSALRKKERTFACVFISSTAGLQGESGGSVYSASKFGLIGFVSSFAAEIAQLGGRANTVCPGNVDSSMLTELASEIGSRTGKSGASTLQEWIQASAFKRLISADEVAETCCWLISPESSGISGQIIVVDGPRA